MRIQRSTHGFLAALVGSAFLFACGGGASTIAPGDAGFDGTIVPDQTGPDIIVPPDRPITGNDTGGNDTGGNDRGSSDGQGGDGGKSDGSGGDGSGGDATGDDGSGGDGVSGDVPVDVPCVNPTAAISAEVVDRFGDDVADAVLANPPAGFALGLRVPSLSTVTLLGDATDPDSNGPFGFTWRLISAPNNNTAGLSGAPGGGPDDLSTETNPSLFAQLAGFYVVGVRARDAQGCPSDEQQIQIEVRPEDGLQVEVSWDQPVDVDVQVTRDNGPFSQTVGDTASCFWGNPAATFGSVACNSQIDDLHGCNPEDILLDGVPDNGSTFGVFVHVFCNHPGHLNADTTDSYACYETTEIASVTPQVRFSVNGRVARLDGTTTNAILTRSLANGDVWKVATLLYQDGTWRVQPANDPITQTVQCQPGSGQASCVCGNGQVDAVNDQYCGPEGAACRQTFP